jgi:ribonuclease HI
MLEEKVLARQAGERFTKASNEYRRIAGYKMSLPKCYRRVQISWVKVKGHSKEEGNDAAYKLAGYAQNGGAKNVQEGRLLLEPRQ